MSIYSHVSGNTRYFGVKNVFIVLFIIMPLIFPGYIYNNGVDGNFFLLKYNSKVLKRCS